MRFLKHISHVLLRFMTVLTRNPLSRKALLKNCELNEDGTRIVASKIVWPQNDSNGNTHDVSSLVSLAQSLP